MNIKMDLLAKATIDCSTISPQKYQIKGKPWVCYIDGQCQIKQVGMTLQMHINTIMIKEHWNKKQRYKQGQAHMINFKCAG